MVIQKCSELLALKAVSSRLKAETDSGCIINDTYTPTHTLTEHMEQVAFHLVVKKHVCSVAQKGLVACNYSDCTDTL